MSLAGGTNAKEDLLAKISKLEDIKGGLQKEINGVTVHNVQFVELVS